MLFGACGSQGQNRYRLREMTFSDRSLLIRALEFKRMDRLRRMARLSSLACADSGDGCTPPGVETAVPYSGGKVLCSRAHKMTSVRTPARLRRGLPESLHPKSNTPL